MRIAVFGAGAVGARVARQLASTDGIDAVLVHDRRSDRAQEVVAAVGPPAAPFDDDGGSLDAAVLALPGRYHIARAAELVSDGVAVVSTADGIEPVSDLLDLDAEARARNVPVVVGAGFSPGLTCLLARHAAARFDAVDEIHVAKAGTGGPACAHQHHTALAGTAVDWRDGGWVRRRGGSGRELVWFPDPVGPHDCYRAGLPDSLLLVPAFAGVERVTARMAANRRDRITAHLPMLRRPHAEGGPGAVRVEVRGRQGGARAVEVLGAIDRPGLAAGAVAALAAVAAVRGELHRSGAGGLAALADPMPFLTELARRGVRAAVFEGAG